MSHHPSPTYSPPGSEQYMDLYDFLQLCESIVESEEQLITEAEDGSTTCLDDEFATFFNLDPDLEPSGFGSGTAECFDSTDPFCCEPLLSSKPRSAGEIVTTTPPCTLEEEEEKEVQSGTNFNEFQLCLGPDRPTSEASAPQPSTSLPPSPLVPSAFSYVFPLQQWPTQDTAYPPRGTARNHAMGIAEMEDKRRRSNEASARFRANKKQRDKELERRVADMKGKAKSLSDRVIVLETENRALKDTLLSRQPENGDKIDGEKST